MKEVEKAPSNIVEFPKDRITNPFVPRPGETSPLLKNSPEAIAKIKAENKAAIERLKAKKKTPPEDLASGGLVDLLSL